MTFTPPAMPSMPSLPARPPTPSMPPIPNPTSAASAAKAAAAAGASSKTPKKPDPADPAVSIRFHLSLDNQPIGWWTSFDGLGMETAVETREEGGNNMYIHQLPTRLKYSNVKLSRPINQDSALVAVWFMKVVKLRPTNQTAVIQACGGQTEKEVIAEWSLQNVVPVRWTGPSFSVESPKVATETLELAFHGFLPPVAKKGA